MGSILQKQYDKITLNATYHKNYATYSLSCHVLKINLNNLYNITHLAM